MRSNRQQLPWGFLLFLLPWCSLASTSSAELIFPLQDKHVHSSSIVELPDGDLFACWFHGSGERKANDVVIQGARWQRSAGRWTPVFQLADTPQLPDCNPVLFVDGQDRLWLFWVVPVANRWEQSVLKYRRADAFHVDGSPRWSWQDSIHLVPGERFAESLRRGFEELGVEEGMWAEYALPYSRMLIDAAQDPIKRQVGWMTRTHPLVLSSGRIVLPLYSDGFNAGLMALSDDAGETWRASAPIVGLGPIQPSVVQKSDGTLLAYLRDSGGPPYRILQATSRDDGETWSVATDTTLPNPGSSLEMIRLNDGRFALVYNDLEQSRRRLVLAFSSDEGESWTLGHVLDDDPGGKHSYAYPSLIQARDGTVHVTYSFAGPEGASIKHVAIKP